MVVSAARLPERLVAEIDRVDDGTISIAEICRRVGAVADRLGLCRPSYERVRLLVHEGRLARSRRRGSGVAADVVLRARPPAALLDCLAGVSPPRDRGTSADTATK